MDVRMPDGTVIKNVPAGTTQSELSRRLSLLNAGTSIDPSARVAGSDPAPPWAGRSFVPASDPRTDSQAREENTQRMEADSAAYEKKTFPLIERESFHDKSIVPIMATLSSLMVPGSGWGALALQSLGAAAGGGAGEAMRRDVRREPQDLKATAKVATQQGAGNFVGGAIVKGLGAAAKKLFSSPLNDPQAAAAQFAKDEGVPFPLSSAAPGSGAARTQQSAGGLLPGAIRNQGDANRVAQFLNSKVGTMTEKAEVFDDAARQGQQFLRQVFEPGEVAYKNAFSQFTEQVGENAPIPTTNILAAAEAAATRLENRGQTSGGLYQRLRTIIKKSPQTYTPGEIDELYGAVIKQAFNSKAAAGGEGKILLSGIVKDMDAMAPGFADEIAKATVIREQFRELRDIPALQRLASEMGDRGSTKGTIDWMNTLFTAGNGKALAKVRELNPELYHDLADAYLARQIDNAAGYSRGGLGRQVDGAKLRTWFEQNAAKIKEIYGAPQAKALDNFTNYAAHMTGAVDKVAKGAGPGMDLGTFGRAGVEGALMLKNPVLMVPTEAASFVLARGLSDPSSQLFKLFTEGFSPATRSFMIRSGELAGRSAGSGSVQDQR